MRFSDRLLTIAVTATLTSAAWIVVGPVYFESDEPRAIRVSPGSSVDVPVPATSPAVQPADVPAPPVGDSSGLAMPVPSVPREQLVDTYSDERAAGARLHEAIDIAAPAGTPVVAAAPGAVERLFHSEDGGNTVYVRSADRRTLYYYAHLQGYAPGLREGQHVERGDPLGAVGSTGNASREVPHLHFAIMRTSPGSQWWEPATAINPYPMLSGR